MYIKSESVSGLEVDILIGVYMVIILEIQDGRHHVSPGSNAC